MVIVAVTTTLQALRQIIFLADMVYGVHALFLNFKSVSAFFLYIGQSCLAPAQLRIAVLYVPLWVCCVLVARMGIEPHFLLQSGGVLVIETIAPLVPPEGVKPP